ncbi:CopG family ribbon-helix-helix protein [Xenorhabdus bovienii]|uniref:CopG family ribbon-helix-helix protein n=1 Tax=Xenorhabdus bovienii TaxID=40576 RepID=UPI003DA57812
MKASNIPVSVKIEPTMKARMERLGESRDRSMHWLLTDAIKKYVEQEEKREALKEAVQQSWLSFQETGLHVSSDEAYDWLISLSEGQYKEPPKCHV